MPDTYIKAWAAPDDGVLTHVRQQILLYRIVITEIYTMHKSTRKPVSYLLAAMLALTSMAYVPGAYAASLSQSIDEEPTGGTMMADTFLVRPFMLAGTVVGLATFIVTLPFSALGGNVGEAGNTLVVEPAKYTFVRPLGEL
jgi:hypothetical protein